MPDRLIMAGFAEWKQYGKCRKCGVSPGEQCVDTRRVKDVPKAEPHRGRPLMYRKPYPREAALRAARQRLINQGKIKG